MFLAITSFTFAQHGGHGGGRHGGGGHGRGHGGHGFGGHGGRHFSGHGGGRHGFGGHGSIGHRSIGHGGISHGGIGRGGIGHGGIGHNGGHHGFSHNAHRWYPQFGFYVTPLYGGYGYSPYYSPGFYSGSYTTGYRAVESAIASPHLVEQQQPRPEQPVAAARPITTPEGEAFQRKAEAAFRAGDFQRAARMANHALVEMPRQGKLLLFAAQTLFAVGDYRSAAAVIHQAASQLDSNQWGYVVENYKQYYRGRAFVEQMDRLNEYLEENPNAAYAHFLRGYQHGFLDHPKAALRDLNKAVELESRDKLAAQLIERFGGKPPVVPDQPALESNSVVDPSPSPAVLDNGDEQSPESTKTEEHAKERGNHTHDQ